MELPWPQIVFLVATSVTLPLHFAIIISIVRRRKLSLFHVMVLSQFISQIPLIILPIFQWSIALLIVSPILQPSYIVTYELRSTLEISIPPSLIALGNIVLLPSSSLLFAACVICYVLIVKYLLQYTSHHSEPRLKRHELRLGAQVAGLVIAFMVQVAYNSGTYLLNSLDQTLLRSWRTMGPLAFGFLSYIHPWTCLAFNQKMRNRVFRIFCSCFRYKVDVTTSNRIFSLSRNRD